MQDRWETKIHEWRLDVDRQEGAPLDFWVYSRHYQLGTWFLNARFASLLDAREYINKKVAEDHKKEDEIALRLLFAE